MTKYFAIPFALFFERLFAKGMTDSVFNEIYSLWITRAKTLNSLCINCMTVSNNSVQLRKPFEPSLEQRGEQPVANLVQQLLNKPRQAVYGARTVFEQLFPKPHLFKTTNVSSSALTPSYASRKPLKHNSFLTLSTIY
jgi:hypothetical protein